MSHLIESVADPEEVPKLRKGNPQSRGRARRATEFDEILQPCYNQGWQKVQVDNEEDLASVMKDLRKAATDFGYGMDRIPSEDRSMVYFRVRDRHPKRSHTSADNGEEHDEEGDDNGHEQEDGPEFDLSVSE